MAHTILVRLDVDDEYADIHPDITATDYLEGSKAHGWEVVTERVFTESEVRAIAMQAIGMIRSAAKTGIHVGQACGYIGKACYDAGIVLDPA